MYSSLDGFRLYEFWAFKRPFHSYTLLLDETGEATCNKKFLMQYILQLRIQISKQPIVFLKSETNKGDMVNFLVHPKYGSALLH